MKTLKKYIQNDCYCEAHPVNEPYQSYLRKGKYFPLTLVVAITSTLLSCLTSCKKLVTVDPPSTSIVTTNTFNNDQTAIAAQLAIYLELQSYLNSGSGLKVLTGASADELNQYNTGQFNIDVYRNNLNAQNDGGFNGLWTQSYKYIYQENAILENVQASTGVSDRVKKITKGEAVFMRAYFYFQLVNMFGDVPLVTTTDYTKNSTLPRTPVAQVYQQMVTDLQQAQTLLPSSYIDANDNTLATVDKVRPTTWAASALLARVYLYMGQYGSAEQQAASVITNGGYSLSPLTGTKAVFNANSSEAIWQLVPVSNLLYTQEGFTFILIAPPSTSSSTGSTTISTTLLNAFEPNDARKTNWIGTYTSGSTVYSFSYKYKATTTATSLTEYSMVFRLAELYLIRAEAEANGATGGTTAAISDLNIIRNRAGLPNYAGATDQQSVLTAILHERQVELFTEGHRWYDLKRTKTIDVVMSVVAPLKGGIWNTYQQLYPLAVNDLQYDPNLIQNIGY